MKTLCDRNLRTRILTSVSMIVTALYLNGCGGSGQETAQTDVTPPEQTAPPTPVTPTPPADNPTDIELRNLIAQNNIVPLAIEGIDAPAIESQIAQLGKQLFFAKNLGGESSVACVSCHHPMLGGADALSLPVGVNAVNELDQSSHDLLGNGRFFAGSSSNLPIVPRNAPTVFNMALNDEAVFWDGRIERSNTDQILTPDSVIDQQGRRQPDANLPTGISLADAQARFPVTSAAEMRGEFSSGSDNQALRAILAGRFDNSDPNFDSTWPQYFEQAFRDQDVDFDKIALAIAEYERSMVFIDNPWRDYLLGDNDGLNEQQKQGAILFFTPTNQGGAGCSDCHNGPTLSDSQQHLVAFPQMGPGKGNDSGAGENDDFGRQNITGDEQDRHHFRTPTLLNIASSAPYGHAGTYQTLEEVVRHYVNPQGAVNDLFAVQNGQAFGQGNSDDAPICQLQQLADIAQKTNQSCESLLEGAFQNSQSAVQHLQQARNGQVAARNVLDANARLNGNEVAQVVAFLEALTDPCINDRACMAPWLLDAQDEASFPDDSLLISIDENGIQL